MRTLNRVHSFSPAAFIFKAEPLALQSAMYEPSPVPASDRATNMTTAFQANAWAMGQWCLPYSVPVRRMRFSNRAQQS